jgi:hypothetical protein
MRSRIRPARRSCPASAASTSGAVAMRAPGDASAGVGLAQQVGDRAQVDRQSVGVAREARRVLDHPRHRAAIERPQAGLVRQPGDQRRVGGVGRGAARHRRLEVGHHLEQVVELGIDRGEQVVDVAITEQHDLDVERDRRRLERHGRDHAQRLAQALDA